MQEHATTPASPALAYVRICSLQSVASGAGWHVEAARSLSADLFLWITKGQGRSTIDGITRGYGPHTAVFVPAGVMHGIEVGPRVQGYAVFIPRGMEPGLPRNVMQIRTTDMSEQGEATRMIEVIQSEMSDRREGFDRAVAAQITMLSVWLERRTGRNERAAPARSSAAQRIVRDFAALLEREIDAGKSVSDFARALSVTPTHLSRVCRDSFGKPASEVLQDRIILEARRMLGETDLKVQEVSARLGFSSPAYFTRLFAQRTGLSPSVFRQRHSRGAHV
ncbi:AraC family transcriptional regulator [Maritimibacter sp. 55A14]|uniref:helix-turn-helix domain-containing protein n=1 Tax=Maritimibacter sp. 55A14 TaxID=2174844 RepID=UPI001304D5E0|nr:AraC family transcriptional regulator [Maritimibacter sp. 55A14]